VVAQHERDGQLDQRDAGVVGQLGEPFDGIQLALVLRQRQVEAGFPFLLSGAAAEW
jgi:hypothetical protein